MNHIKTAYALNIAIFVLEVFAVGWMMSGLSGMVLSASRIAALRYFTIDSNILMGICALVAALDQRRVLKGRKRDVSAASLVLKLVGTTSVTLTMIITIFFLAPTMGRVYGVLSLFAYSNFFLHLLNPILSIVTFVAFEKSRAIAFKHTFTGIVPMLAYAVFYVAAAATHMHDGVIDQGYDWYGFFFAGIQSVAIVVPILVALTYAISFVLWKLNRRGAPEG